VDGRTLVADLCPICIGTGRAVSAVPVMLAQAGVQVPDVQVPERAFARDPDLAGMAPPPAAPTQPLGFVLRAATEAELGHFVESWVSVTPRERHQLASYAFGGGDKSPFVAAMRQAGGIEPAFRHFLGDEIATDIQSRFATSACPEPSLLDIVNSVVMIGSTVGMPPDLRPLPIPDAVVEMLKNAPPN
jgi:hypothetical protein